VATIDINSIQSAKRLQADNAKVQKKLSDIESAISQSAKTITKYLDGKVTKTELVNQLDSVRTPDVEKVTELLEQIKQSISEQQPTDLTPITDGIQAVISTTKQLADKIPTNEAKDYTDGLNALLSTAQDIEQTLKDKELSVNVAAPNVAVDAPDLKPLHADNQKIIKAITDIAMPKFSTAELQDGQKELLDVLKKILAKPVGGGGGGVQTTLTRNDNAIAVVNPDGSNVGGSSGGGLTDAELRATPVPTTINNTLVPEQHDEIQATYPTTSSEVYTYKLSGVSVAVVTVTYADATKEVLTSVVRS